MPGSVMGGTLIPFSANSLQPASLWRTMTADATGEPCHDRDGRRVVVVDLRIPFVRLVLFFVKAAFAAIPAAIIVGFLLMLVTALFAVLVGDGGFVMMRRSF